MNFDKPFFSVVIPTYNRANLISETLDSVLSQRFQNFEIIIVDNCSTDSTEEVLAEYLKDKRIRFLRNSENKERAFSRNRGMKEAKSDWVTLLDSDDFMYLGLSGRCTQFYKLKPDLRLFQNKYELVDNQRNVIYRFPFPSLKNPQKALANGNFLSCIGVFIHREVFSTILFDENPELTGSEDYEYWIRVLAHFNPKRIDRFNSGIRQHDNRSVNDTYTEKLFKNLGIIESKILSQSDLSNAFAKYLNHFRASFHFYAAINAGDSAPKSIRLGFLIKAILYNPESLFSKRPWENSLPNN